MVTYALSALLVVFVMFVLPVIVYVAVCAVVNAHRRGVRRVRDGASWE